jgi:hypothetical protein
MIEAKMEENENKLMCLYNANKALLYEIKVKMNQKDIK